MEKKKDKPEGITNKDLQDAITAESIELIREEKEKILHRAKKRLAKKFRQ